MKKEIINELETALNKTTMLLAGFSQSEINITPSSGGWSAAQVGRHLYKSSNGTDELLKAQSETAGRQPDEKVDWLKQIFLNFETKLNAPDFIIPEDKEYNKNELIISLEDTNKKIVEAAKEANLTDVAPLPEGHPLMGITKLEMLYFITYHTMRHNRQIENLDTRG